MKQWLLSIFLLALAVACANSTIDKEDVEGWAYNDTLDYLEEHEKSTVSDILETDISFSYRVFYKNGNTRYFKQWVKP